MVIEEWHNVIRRLLQRIERSGYDQGVSMSVERRIRHITEQNSDLMVIVSWPSPECWLDLKADLFTTKDLDLSTSSDPETRAKGIVKAMDRFVMRISPEGFSQ